MGGGVKKIKNTWVSRQTDSNCSCQIKLEKMRLAFWLIIRNFMTAHHSILALLFLEKKNYAILLSFVKYTQHIQSSVKVVVPLCFHAKKSRPENLAIKKQSSKDQQPNKITLQ